MTTPWILTEVHRNPDCLEWIIFTERPAGATEGCKRTRASGRRRAGANPASLHQFMQLKSQLNVRIAPVCVDLIKLERKSIPGCASDGEALESIIYHAATSPAAREILTQAALQEPLFAAVMAGKTPAR